VPGDHGQQQKLVVCDGDPESDMAMMRRLGVSKLPAKAFFRLPFCCEHANRDPVDNSPEWATLQNPDASWTKDTLVYLLARIGNPVWFKWAVESYMFRRWGPHYWHPHRAPVIDGTRAMVEAASASIDTILNEDEHGRPTGYTVQNRMDATLCQCIVFMDARENTLTITDCLRNYPTDFYLEMFDIIRGAAPEAIDQLFLYYAKYCDNMRKALNEFYSPDRHYPFIQIGLERVPEALALQMVTPPGYKRDQVLVSAMRPFLADPDYFPNNGDRGFSRLSDLQKGIARRYMTANSWGSDFDGSEKKQLCAALHAVGVDDNTIYNAVQAQWYIPMMKLHKKRF
jgi:hypothetical protein